MEKKLNMFNILFLFIFICEEVLSSIKSIVLFYLLGISFLSLVQFLFLIFGLFLILWIIDLCEIVRASDII